MILKCPACGARFVVDPGQIGSGGRQVRCGKCRHSWVQAPLPEQESGAPERPGPLPSLKEFDEARRRSRAAPGAPSRTARRPATAVAWGVFALVVVGLAAGAWFGRAQIISAVPEAARLYQAIGLGAERVGEGLEFRDVTRVRRVVDGERVLLIEGAIVNVSEQARPVPKLRASLTDAEGNVLTDWTFSADSALLEPGEVARFQTSTQNPPREGDLRLVFHDGRQEPQ